VKRNPLDYERFNKLFHAFQQVIVIARKLDVDERHSSYFRDIGLMVDQLFTDNVKEENENG